MSVNKHVISGNPQLDGTPRVHQSKLHTNENPQGEERLYLGDTLFTGVAWNELNGYRFEKTYKDGLLHGRSIEVHPNGQLAFDGSFIDEDPIGEHRRWYPNGVLRNTTLYEGYSYYYPLIRRYNEQGQLVEELDHDSEQCRYWYDDGSLRFIELKNTNETCYAPDGTQAFHGDSRKKEHFIYNDETIFQNAVPLFGFWRTDSDLFRWLHLRLDADDERAIQLLIQLTNHPNLNIAETALMIIESRGYREAIPLVRKHIHSTRRKLPDQGGYVGTFAELAEKTLIRLTLPEDKWEKACQEVDRRARLREERELEELHNQQMTWPETTAYYLETNTWMAEVRSAESLCDGEADSQNIEYSHCYQYIVNGCTYRASVWTKKPTSPSETVQVRFNPQNPTDNVVVK